MFLYDNNGEFIDVYKLEPKFKEIKDYKKKKMKGMEYKVLKGRSFPYFDEDYHNGEVAKYDYVMEGNFDTISSNQLKIFSWHHGRIHELYSLANGSERSDYWLKNYYDMEKFDYRISLVTGYTDVKYIVLLDEEYHFNVMSGIINIPESLYLLEAILINRLDLIGDKDINEQLQLFDIQYYGRISVNLLQDICKYQLFPCTYETIMERMENNQNALGLVRRLAK